MKRKLTITVALAALLAASAAFAQTLGTIRLGQAVVADGKPLAAGTYQIRLTADEPKPAVGQSPGGERWVEFVKGGTIAGREIAVVLTADEVAQVAKGPQPALNRSRVDVLKGGDYVRIWINHGGTHYLVNLPVQI
jgi:hypothetical protein